jgi:hypothetical protein
MSVPFGRWSFTSGEIAPSLYGRVDFAGYINGSSTCRNMCVSYRGGLYSRAGTAFVGFSRQTWLGRVTPPRLIPFQFSINQGLVLEFGEQYMRVISDGAFVTEGLFGISGITQANPGVVHVPLHGYATGDWVFIANAVGMTELNGQTFPIIVIDANHFSLTDIYGNPINTSTFPAYVNNGTVARIYTLATIYNDVDLEYLKFTESADVMSICDVNQQSSVEYPTQDLSRIADDDWSFAVVNAAATVTAPTFIAVASSSSGSVDYQYVVTAISPTDGSESIASPIGEVDAAVDIASTAGTITVQWSAVNGVNAYNVYKATPGYGTPPPVGSLFGYAGTALGVQFLDSNIVADFTQVPPTHQNPFARGAVLAVNPVSGGGGYTTATVTISTGTGSGAVITPVITSGQVSGYIVDDPGQNYLPTDTVSVTGSAGVEASGTYTATASNPTNGQTIVLNGVTWTFVTSGATGAETNIRTNLEATLSQLAADLNSSVNASIDVATYSAGPTSLTITYATVGAAGNAYTLGAGTYGGTVSGPTLTGGVDAGGASATAALVVGPTTGTYPGVVGYFQQRRVYANTLNAPDTYFMSQPGSFTNFDSRIPTIASDAIIGTPWSLQVNGIQWLIPTSGGLLVMTGLSAWLLAGVGSFATNVQPITPSTQDAVPQAFSGCSPTVPPIKIDYDVIYLDSTSSYYYDLPYQLYTLSEPIDITELSAHLFTGFTIREHAWCQQPNKVIWAVRSDGAMLSLTYYKTQKIAGWARHDTNGLFQSVCSVREPPIDALYLCTKRFPGGNVTFMIERMNNRIWTSDDNCWCVDCALSLPQNTPNAVITASSATGLGTVDGYTGLVGGAGYSPLTQFTIVDQNGKGPGVGASATGTIVGGVVEALSIVGGSGYLSPTISAYDPAGSMGGSGFAATLTLNNSAEFDAPGVGWSSANLGSVIRMGGGIATITQIIDSDHVVAVITTPIAQTRGDTGIPEKQLFGNWTVTAPVTQVSGLQYLAGLFVTGTADGQVIPPTLVPPSGTIALAAPATSIVVGLAFTTQVQSIYLPEPTLQGQRKKEAAVTVRLELSRGVQVGTNQPDGATQSPPSLAPTWSEMVNLPDNGVPPFGSTVKPLFTGDARTTLEGGWDTRGQIAIQQPNPLPLSVLALAIEALPGDTPENKASPPPQKRGR